MNVFYTYLYIDSCTNEPFYVGKGSGNRATTKQNRNKQVLGRIRNLQNRFTIEKINALSETASFWLERCFISAYGRKNNGTGNLLNHTDGGEGLSGYTPSIETRQLISQTLRQTLRTTEAQERMSVSNTGNRNPMFGRSGINCPSFGKKHSDERKKRLYKFITCPHCSKTGMTAGMNRWHFDNCKMRS